MSKLNTIFKNSFKLESKIELKWVEFYKIEENMTNK